MSKAETNSRNGDTPITSSSIYMWNWISKAEIDD